MKNLHLQFMYLLLYDSRSLWKNEEKKRSPTINVGLFLWISGVIHKWDVFLFLLYSFKVNSNKQIKEKTLK